MLFHIKENASTASATAVGYHVTTYHVTGFYMMGALVVKRLNSTELILDYLSAPLLETPWT